MADEQSSDSEVIARPVTQKTKDASKKLKKADRSVGGDSESKAKKKKKKEKKKDRERDSDTKRKKKEKKKKHREEDESARRKKKEKKKEKKRREKTRDKSRQSSPSMPRKRALTECCETPAAPPPEANPSDPQQKRRRHFARSARSDDRSAASGRAIRGYSLATEWGVADTDSILVHAKSEMDSEPPNKHDRSKFDGGGGDDDDDDDDEGAAKEDVAAEQEPAGAPADDDVSMDDADVWDFSGVVRKYGGDRDDEEHDFWHALESQKEKTSKRDADMQEAPKEAIDSVTLGRSTHLVPHIYLPLFPELCKGAFVRASVPSSGRQKMYALYEVIEVKVGAINARGQRETYQVSRMTEAGKELLQTDWLLHCQSGRHFRDIKVSSVSDEKSSEEEFVAFCQRRERAGLARITRRQCEDKRQRISALYRKHYSGRKSEKDVEETVHIRQRLRGRASVNLIETKIRLSEDLERLKMSHADRERANRRSGTLIVPPEYREMERREGTAAAWASYVQDHGVQIARHKERLRELEERVDLVLSGQNSAFETLAQLTHHNAKSNQGRLESEDAADAAIFGRKLSRGKSCWVISDDGWVEKEKAISSYWEESGRSERETRERTEIERITAKRKGTTELLGIFEELSQKRKPAAAPVVPVVLPTDAAAPAAAAVPADAAAPAAPADVAAAPSAQ